MENFPLVTKEMVDKVVSESLKRQTIPSTKISKKEKDELEEQVTFGSEHSIVSNNASIKSFMKSSTQAYEAFYFHQKNFIIIVIMTIVIIVVLILIVIVSKKNWRRLIC